VTADEERRRRSCLIARVCCACDRNAVKFCKTPVELCRLFDRVELLDYLLDRQLRKGAGMSHERERERERERTA